MQTEEEQPDLKDLPGVGAATAKKLREADYDTVLSIAAASRGELVDTADVSESSARKIIKAARETLDMGFETGEELLERRKDIEYISTGCESFDDILGGGFETESIVEVFGQHSSGKTQIGHVLPVKLYEKHPDASTVYIDTESTFRPERVKEIAEANDIDPDEVLNNIKVARAYNSDHQMLLAQKVDKLISEDDLNLKLVVVDSLTSHFRSEFVGRGTLAERQQKLNKHMHTLLKLAEKYNICVYVTNQVMANPDNFFGDPTEAIGGHIVAHASTHRIYLRKGKKGSRVAKLVDSPSMPEAEAAFKIKEDGLEDFSG